MIFWKHDQWPNKVALHQQCSISHLIPEDKWKSSDCTVCALNTLTVLTSMDLFFSWATSDMPFSTCLAWSSWAESLRRLNLIFLARGSR